jgi:hypothetical protein
LSFSPNPFVSLSVSFYHFTLLGLETEETGHENAMRK